MIDFIYLFLSYNQFRIFNLSKEEDLFPFFKKIFQAPNLKFFR